MLLITKRDRLMYDIIRFLSARETSFGRSELDLPVMLKSSGITITRDIFVHTTLVFFKDVPILS